jgi:SAM-dependent methyltransferase
VSYDPASHRRVTAEAWEAAAPGWDTHQELMREIGAPVSDWLLQALALKPGERVLELAGGMGETGLLAAGRVAPDGEVIVSDRSEGMLGGAKRRAAELGVDNVDFRVLDAESIDLDTASVDAAICRWGYMLMTDPGAALAETRRVLRVGGRLALAVWDTPERNPWFALPAQELRERGALPAPDAHDDASRPGPQPGPFALADRDALGELLGDAGFTGVRIETVDVLRRHAGFDELWDTTLDLSHSFHEAVMSLPAGEMEELRASLERRFAPYTTATGALEIPGRTLVAAADA